MNWWLIIKTPTGVHAWQVDDDPDPADTALRARVLLDMPPGDRWQIEPNGWDVQLTPGPPHPNLAATERPVAELARVNAAAVADYAAAGQADAEQVQVAAAREVLAGLPDDVKASLLAELQAVDAAVLDVLPDIRKGT